MQQITFSDFEKMDIRIGTVQNAEINPEANKPAFTMEIDFGPMGIKTSSAQLTENYEASDLIGKQIVAVVNFPVKNIAGVRSQVLVLGVMSENKGVVLLQPDRPVENGELIK